MMRSLRSREKMSLVWMPPETVSVTKGMGSADFGACWWGCWRVVVLRVGWKGWKPVDMLRVVVGRRVRTIEGRRARRVDLVMGSMVRLWCCCVWCVVVDEVELGGV
jgi:hypothetical protein